jgi:hypothetical protein
MKKDKWLKWKIGAALTLGVAALFQTIRASADYQEKIAAASAAKPDSNEPAQVQQQQDPVIDEWLNGQGDSSSGTSGRRFRHHSSGFFQNPGGNSGGGSSDLGGSSGFDSSTGRS